MARRRARQRIVTSHALAHLPPHAAQDLSEAWGLAGAGSRPDGESDPSSRCASCPGQLSPDALPNGARLLPRCSTIRYNAGHSRHPRPRSHRRSPVLRSCRLAFHSVLRMTDQGGPYHDQPSFFILFFPSSNHGQELSAVQRRKRILMIHSGSACA